MTIAAGVIVRETLKTDLGMFALWNRHDFSGIVDYETWRPAFGNDQAIERHIAKGTLVPIKVQSYGAACTFEIRVGSLNLPADLTPAEKRSIIDSSEPYLFRSLGGLNLSSIESIGSEVGNDVVRLRMIPGDYAVTVHRLGSLAFIILVNPEDGGIRYRSSAETFEAW
jgi:hypothetical protein